MKFHLLTLLIPVFILMGCVGKPDGIEPVPSFNVDRYLGTWYEIARLDHSFERGLSHVSAEYAKNDDGTIRVINKGYSAEKDAWNTANGKAKFVGDENIGHLKVSFFGPFYGSYIIFELEKDGYSYAFVTGPNKSYLWFLSRTPEVREDLKSHFTKTARKLGYDADSLIFVTHDKKND